MSPWLKYKDLRLCSEATHCDCDQSVTERLQGFPNEKNKTKLGSRLSDVLADWKIRSDHTLILRTVSKDKTTHTDNRTWLNCAKIVPCSKKVCMITILRVLSCSVCCSICFPVCHFVGRTKCKCSVNAFTVCNGFHLLLRQAQVQCIAWSTSDTTVHLTHWPQ